MENKKSTTVLLTVIGIATLLVAVVGATFAYFTAQTTGDTQDTNVTVTAATLGTVTFNEGTAIKLGVTDPVYPGASDELTFSIQSDANSTDKVGYVVYMDVVDPGEATRFVVGKDAAGAEYTNSNTNIQYQVCQITQDNACTTAGDSWTNVTATQITSNAEIQLAAKDLDPAGAKDEYKLFVRLNEVGYAQNEDQGKTFTAKLRISTNTIAYTTDANNQKSTSVISTGN